MYGQWELQCKLQKLPKVSVSVKKSKCKCEEKKSIILKICADPTKKVYGENKGLKLKLRLNRNNIVPLCQIVLDALGVIFSEF